MPHLSPASSWPAYLFFAFIVLLTVATFCAGFILDNVWAWSAGIIYVLYDLLLLLYMVIATRKLQPATLAITAQLPTVGIVIPARNEASVLPDCLNALLAQQLVPAHILLVDDGSTDNTANLLNAQYGLPSQMGLHQSDKYPQLQLLRQPNQGKSRALNAGYPLLNTDIIVTLDADTILDQHALQQVAQAFQQQPDLAAAGGVIIPVCNKNKPSLRTTFFDFFQKFEYVFSFLSRAAWMQANSLLLVSGAFAAYRREVLHELGGFANHSLVEDYEINHRLYRYAYAHHKAWKIGVIGTALATTDAPRTFKTFFHQRRRWFAGFLETQFSNFDMVANRKYGVIGKLMLPIKSIDAIQPLIGLVALLLLLYFVVIAKTQVLLIIAALFTAKLLLDLVLNIGGYLHYRQWVACHMYLPSLSSVILATILAPFSFQFLRLFSACLGWWIFLVKRYDWLPQRES